ncbi:MAG: NAD(P)/FAD-dependent oxidoreductase [Clostridia bacterium]
MSFQINNIRMTIDEDINLLREKASKELKVRESEIKNFRIVKESIDARRKNKIGFVYSVLVDLYQDEHRVAAKLSDQNITHIIPKQEPPISQGTEKIQGRPIVIGTGPAGLFAGLILAINGYKPLLLERGGDVNDRSKKVREFWQTNELDPESNVQFGEGGAGTFSDGKLTTRINDTRNDKVLEAFVEAGAPHEIIYKGKPHIGTDLLKEVVKNIRNRIISLGGEVRFYSKVTDISFSNHSVSRVTINDQEDIPCNVVILAIGHSARDTYEMLLRKGIEITQKPFSIGVRIEHPQRTIDRAQYGDYAGHPRLKAADYQLVYKSPLRTCYSFCMCPGGIVVAAASEKDSIVTNGMSEFARDRENANSALVVSVGPQDFESSHPLAGVEFQRKWERLAFKIGGNNYSAPAQLVGDFLSGTGSKRIGAIKPSYTGNVAPADLAECLPEYVIKTMKEGLVYFDKKVKGYAETNVIMTGVETRTSAPIRINRSETGEAVNLKGLYPTGEGAGYAGGIISAAVDGIRAAEQIIKKYSPID